MKAIKQEDGMGCGVACTAFVLGVKYEEARGLFRQGKEKALTVGFSCKEIVEVLNKAGFRYQNKYIKPKLRNKIYDNHSIVFIKRSKKYRYGHYLARYKDKWMDPWINFQSKSVKAGFRKRLPGRAIYALFQ